MAEKKKIPPGLILVLSIVVFSAVIYMALAGGKQVSAAIGRSKTYRQAQTLFEEGSYDKARDLFLALAEEKADYKDSAEMAERCLYEQGNTALQMGDLDKAASFFCRCQYSDSEELFKACETAAAFDSFQGALEHNGLALEDLRIISYQAEPMFESSFVDPVTGVTIPTSAGLSGRRSYFYYVVFSSEDFEKLSNKERSGFFELLSDLPYSIVSSKCSVVTSAGTYTWYPQSEEEKTGEHTTGKFLYYHLALDGNEVFKISSGLAFTGTGQANHASSASHAAGKCALCNGTGYLRSYYGGSALEAWLAGQPDYTVIKCWRCNGTGKG